jgi:hypothetical protein
MESAPEQPLVSVLVLNHNGKHFLKDCFESLYASTYPNQELVLVDNASTDDSLQYMREQFPEVRILETGGNIGYSGAYNLSFQHANGKYYVLLNNDTKVDPGWLEPLVEAAEKDPKLGMLQPKIDSMIDLGYFEYAGASGGFMDRYGFPFLRGRIFFEIEKDEGQYDDPAEIFWASGAAFFMRADMLAYTGGLDEDFVHHMEEIDLCWRAHLQGYRGRVVPSSRILHHAGATIAPESYMKLYWNHRNSLIMLRKNVGDEKLAGIMRTRKLLDLLAMIRGLLKGEFQRMRAIWDAYRWLRKNPQKMREKRERVQGERIVHDERIFCKLYPRSIAWDHFILRKKHFDQLGHRIEAEENA